MNITATTQKVGLLGWPLSHSLSPAMHNAAFAASGLDYVYLPLAVPPELLSQAVTGVKALGFAGINVTIPHKIAVMDYLDEIDNSARLVGAVNTIVSKEGRLIGHNTDAGGYISSLKLAGVAVTGKHVVILGAGGAARAVAAGFITNHAASVAISARDLGKVEGIVKLLPINTPVYGTGWDSRDFTAALSKADIVVNTTPLGMYPNIASQPPLPWELLRPSAVISDLVYNPLTTAFMAEAVRRGHTVVGGEGMLAEQGALAFELWTGCSAPRDIMQQVLLSKLSK
ncbi:shikimate dehydrogenase [Sporomusa sphaeroides]|uniref:shikimate dehydrogenase n=1 Tax=Sporomusa sphaeroides TaxID=47679 RepID=UPI00202EA5D2|nr:shikimate dehydrogenase [Sporomusa sphaeroides]MCM0757026.1 shikimate dehydrogenase [Sporomusa sphaeroides DSM 2875]HML31337.1 shikimate dehydrogenase [Sporomusa sphaeroides]